MLQDPPVGVGTTSVIPKSGSPGPESKDPKKAAPTEKTGAEPEREGAEGTGAAPERNADFDKKILGFSAGEHEDLMDTGINTEEYLLRLYDREKEEREELQKYKDDPDLMAGLSETQQREVGARLKVLDYNAETRDLQQQYRDNPNDPKVAAAYNERQKDLKEFRELMYDSEEFGGNEHMIKMKELETELENAKGMEAKNDVKIEMAGEMREFRRDMAREGDEGIDKMISFAEKNQDNNVVKNSGMMDTIKLIKEERAAKASKEKGKEDELENGEVTPKGKPVAGATDSKDKEAAKTAESEVTAAADTGEGAIDRLQLEGQNVDTQTALASAANSTPGQQQEDRGAGLA